MNWNGGALARANLKRQFNDNRQNNRRAFVESRGHDENEAERRGAGTAPNANPSRTQDGMPKRPRQGAPNDRALDRLIGRQHQDYAALGFELLQPERYERRVVPLLEFLEKKFPKGHILSLQLSHQMDITRAPSASLDASNQTASTSRDDTTNTASFHREGQCDDGSNSNVTGVANVTMNTSTSSQSSILCPGSMSSQSPSGFIQARGRNAGGSGARSAEIFKMPLLPARPRVNVGAQDIQEGGINLENV